MKLHNDLIMELPNFVPGDLCEYIVNEFEKCSNDFKSDGCVNYHGEILVDKLLKDSIEISIERLADNNIGDWKSIDKVISKYIRTSVDLYTKYLIDEYAGPNHPENKQKVHTLEPMIDDIKNKGLGQFGLGMRRQVKGTTYKWHYDSQPPKSFVFGILYLNTLKPGEGGCTTFINGRQIRPEAGKIMISPASWTYAHSATEIKGEYKYILPFHIFYDKYTGNDQKYEWWKPSIFEDKYP